ncbi:glycoside hydrolase superfamily [Aspergillus coremiiformis]|uniref:Glycoside hydrolase superfamily n=1 Tax=Aspergillus coremiiformis TaxID=138285 RepID=A0A5N6Z3A6_9EURO|nr:glycoside hydrolase superfamily [Aspergillus coremiiformis]
MEFWLDRGVDGFRVDTVNMYSKPSGFPDAPITDPTATFQPAGMLYCNGPRMHEFLDEINHILARYGAITVGELPHTPDMARVLRYVSAEAKQLDMVFQFDVVDVGLGQTHKYETAPKSYTLPEFKAAISRTQDLIRGTDAWTTVFMENHDQARTVSRWTDDSPRYRVPGAKLLALLQACLSGTQYIYQGQEIGSVNAPKETYPLANYLDIDSCLFISMIKDRYGSENTTELDKAFDALQHLARDHARIPMAWNGKAIFGGFSEPAEAAGKSVQEPWMKSHPLAGEINVASQVDDPDSVLAFWRRVLRMRQEHVDLLVYGDHYTLRLEDRDLYMFVKESQTDGTKALVVLNFTRDEKQWAPPTAQELGLPEDKGVELVPVMLTGGKDRLQVLAPFEGRLYLVKG